MTAPPSDITRLLNELSGGNRTIVDALMPLVYEELRAMAHRQMRREREDHTLDTVALVHEAYLNLIKNEQLDWQSRAHFFSMAAVAMRRILVDYARQRAADKRGGGGAMVTFDEQQIAREVPPQEFLDLDEALHRLELLDPRQAVVVTYKFFGGLKHEEIAEVLGVSVPTVHRDWRLARLWLSREMKHDLAES
jgi:RNA polymerase sigma factor (TIGR02999 family)